MLNYIFNGGGDLSSSGIFQLVGMVLYVCGTLS